MEFTGKTIEIINLSFSFSIAKYYLICFLVVFLVGVLNRHEGTDSKITLANNANVVAALGGMAIGIFFWFVDGADLARSLDAIYLTATSLMLGCFAYLGIYLFTLYQGVSHEGNYQTKTWHFAEAAAFFVFLVFAPVGITEDLRESIDQANQQANNEAQELRIEQLEAQIKLLTEKVGEV